MVSAPISMVSLLPSRVQQAVGENMAAVGIGAHLDFVGRRRKATDRSTGMDSTVHRK